MDMSGMAEFTEFDPDDTRMCEGTCKTSYPKSVPFKYLQPYQKGDELLSKEQLEVAMRTRPGRSVCPKCEAHYKAKRTSKRFNSLLYDRLRVRAQTQVQ